MCEIFMGGVFCCCSVYYDIRLVNTSLEGASDSAIFAFSLDFFTAV